VPAVARRGCPRVEGRAETAAQGDQLAMDVVGVNAPARVGLGALHGPGVEGGVVREGRGQGPAVDPLDRGEDRQVLRELLRLGTGPAAVG